MASYGTFPIKVVDELSNYITLLIFSAVFFHYLQFFSIDTQIFLLSLRLLYQLFIRAAITQVLLIF